MKITPILDRVILKEIKTKEKKTKSGIILPTSVKEAPCEAKIIAINIVITFKYIGKIFCTYFVFRV